MGIQITWPAAGIIVCMGAPATTVVATAGCGDCTVTGDVVGDTLCCKMTGDVPDPVDWVADETPFKDPNRYLVVDAHGVGVLG